MGADICTVAEVRKNGRWEPMRIEMPSIRDYRAFAILGGMRNSFGVIPVAQLRGIPADSLIKPTMDDGYRDEEGESFDHEDAGEYFDVGEFWRSWVLLSELLAIDLNAPVTVSRFVSAKVAEAYRER